MEKGKSPDHLPGKVDGPDHVDSPDLPVQEESRSSRRCLTGPHLWLGGFGLGIGIFLATLEVSIVSTSLITISNELKDYNQISWIITAYLITYTGTLVIWSNLFHLVGLKPSIFAATVIFVGFSAGCGWAQSMKQLIIFRAFQGIGGSGLYATTSIGFVEMVPATYYALIMAVASALTALGMILGPIIGGAISNSNRWRWAFYLNLPAGALGLAACMMAFPKAFPHHCNPEMDGRSPLWRLNVTRKLDTLGALLLLGGSAFLVAALEEGGIRYPWNSTVIVICFAISAALWLGFLVWEWFISRKDCVVEPIFPWRFVRNRIWLGTFVGCFLSGAPLTIAVIELPQRYQIVNTNSPLDAGVKLLAYAIACPLGVAIASGVTEKLRVPFIFVIILGCTLQTIGFALLSTAPTHSEFWNRQYGYSVIAGLGTGSTLSSFYLLGLVAFDKKDQARSIGCGLQFRYLGGAVGIAVSNVALNSHLNKNLPTLIGGAQLADVLNSVSSISRLPVELQEAVRSVYGEAFDWQMRITITFSVATFLAVALIWKKNPIRLAKDGRTE